tara:strand:- start:7004 stop:8179 length:1176 start_codon:yes stop_codon:yes gene_type:complete
MSQTLREIAAQLQESGKRVQLIYAFNGSGKTRLSREFKKLVSPKSTAETDGDEEHRSKLLYYNAFTEDLFYWDNDLQDDTERKLIIQPNRYTDWALKDQGQELNATKHFQRYTNSKLAPAFDSLFTEVRFSIENGGQRAFENIKISKGEESNFIWSIFFSLIEQVVSSLSEPEHGSAGQFEHLEYVFIDDPVSSLDENHLILLAVDLATLIKSNSSGLRFIISTHSPLFFNVLSNELNNKDSSLNWKPRFHVKWLLERTNDDTFELQEQASDTPFSYHLFLMREIDHAIATGNVRKYHFGFMRNILEKTSTFLGYQRWQDLLPKTGEGKTDPYAERLANYGVHSKHAGDEVEPIPPEIKNMLKTIYDHFVSSGHTFKETATAQSGETTSAS